MHKISTPARRLWLLVASAAMMLLFAGLPQAAFAQSAPPAPAGVPLNVTINEDTATTLNTTINFDARYQLQILSAPSPHGVAVASNNGTKFTIIYTPGANQTASPVTFSYRLCETTVVGGDICTSNVGAPATVTINIVAVNDNPIATADTATTNLGTPVTIDVMANDNGGPNEPADTITLVAIVAAPTKGTATISSQQVVYNTGAAATTFCNANPSGTTTDTFSYRIQDSGGATAIGQVTVTIQCPAASAPPTLKLSAPYMISNQTFKVDVILESPTVAIGAIDFQLALDACLLDPDVPTNNGFAGDGNPSNPDGLDDVTSLLPANFTFDARDTEADLLTPPNFVRMIASNPLAQGAVLAGPSQASRNIASIMLRSNPACASSVISATLGFTQTIFTNATGQPVAGTTEPKSVDLAEEINNEPIDLDLTNQVTPDGDSDLYDYVGTFVATDLDEGDVFTYTIIAQEPAPTMTFGIGDPTDGIDDNDELVLYVANPASGTYTLTVQVMDNFGGTFTKTITVEVAPIVIPNMAPIANPDPEVGPSIPVTTTTTITNVLDNDSDPDGGTLSVQSVTNGSHGNVETDGTNVTYVLTDINWEGTDVFTYTISDNDAVDPLTDIATVTVAITQANLGLSGDCNMSGIIEAGDLTALGLEIFDGDGSNWYNATGGTYTHFSPYGCDANKDGQINAGDITCTVRLIFGQTCTAVAAAGSVNATLAVADSVNATRGGTVSVPVALSSAGNAVSGAAFAVNFDADKFDFDSVEVQANADMLDEVNATAGRVEIALGHTAAFADGTIVMVNLTVKADAADGSSAISLSESSLGSIEGAEISVEAVDGSVEIGEEVFSDFIFLPFIGR